MNSILLDSPVARQSTSRDRKRSEDRQAWLADLRAAMKETGWTEDALAEFWDVHRSYPGRLLNGEKPWNEQRIVDLPDDLEAAFEARRAERFGLIVVRPLSGQDAQRAFVAGLFGLLSDRESRLPERADQMAKASIAQRKARTA